MNTRQFHLSNWEELGPVWAISVSYVYTGLLVWVFPQLQRGLILLIARNLSCYLHFALYLCMVDQT